MFTFTLRDFRRVKNDYMNQKRIYYPSRNLLCYELFKLQPTDRGNYIERMVYNQLVTRGYNVEYFGGGHPYDMLVNGKRIEVKSSIAQYNTKNTYKYRFQNIKTSLFDKIILVFITPYEIITQQMSSEKMAEKLIDTTYHNNGKTFCVHSRAA